MQLIEGTVSFTVQVRRRTKSERCTNQNYVSTNDLLSRVHKRALGSQRLHQLLVLEDRILRIQLGEVRGLPAVTVSFEEE